MSERKFRTHYDNLKVSQDAPFEVIKAAYRSLIQKHHPDRNGDDPESHRILSIINQSYEVLSDPEARKQHDEWIAKKLKEQQPKRKAVRSKVSSTKESTTSYSDFYSSTPDYPTVFFNVYLKKYNVKKSDLMNAIWNGKLRTVKVGSNTFVEDKPISASSDLSSKLTSLLLFAFIIGVIALFVMSSNNRPVQSPINYSLPENPVLKQVPMPKTGIIKRVNFDFTDAQLTINVERKNSVYLKLLDPTTEKELLVVFVRSGDSLAVDLPSGDYVLLYAEGKKWYGDELYFGRNTHFARAVDLFDIPQYPQGISKKSLIFYERIHGNLKSKQINLSQFR